MREDASPSRPNNSDWMQCVSGGPSLAHFRSRPQEDQREQQDPFIAFDRKSPDDDHTLLLGAEYYMLLRTDATRSTNNSSAHRRIE
jgi:hypothetical protein